MSVPANAIGDPRTAAVAPSEEGGERWRTDLLLLLMAVIWGLNFSVLKYASAFMAPLAINGLRIPGSALTQLAIARGRGMRAPTSADVRTLILLGVLGNGLYQVCFILGLVRSRVATAALLIAATPAFVALVGRVRGTERLGSRQWVGVGMQLAGCSTVVLGALGPGRAAGSDTVVGVVLLLTSAFSWAIYASWVKQYSHHVEQWYLGGYTMLGGAIVALVVGIPGILAIDWPALPGSVWLSLFYSCFIALVVAYLFYYRGLRVLGPTRTSMYSNLQPLIAMIVAWAMLHERPTATQVVGAGLIVGGLLTTRYAADPAEA